MTKQQIQEIGVSQFAFGTTNGKRQKQGTVKIRLYISKPVLKYIEDTIRQDQTKSERICELVLRGIREK